MSHSTDEDPAIERIAAELRRPVELRPGFDDAVMAQVRASGRVTPRVSPVRRLRDWLVEPRLVALTPMRALAAAAAIALLTLGGAQLLSRRPAGTAGMKADGQWVQFVFSAPGAQRVSLVGDFNGWDTAATPLHPTSADGVWSVSVPLTVGRHDYAFVVNGTEWRPDPAAPRSARSDFGEANSVVTVAERL